MFCANCEAFSFGLICQNCLKILAEISPNSRKIDNLKIYSFYNYSEIEKLILSKHKIYGSKIFEILAKLSFAKFHKIFTLNTKIAAIPLDDHVRNGYSHTAILANALKSEFIEPKFRVLRARSKISYHGKSLEFRKNNPRNFEILKSIDLPIILIDDIVTTGESLRQAKEILTKNGNEILFALTLADARF